MKVTRRAFISLGLGVLPVVGVQRWRRRAAPDLIVAILERRVGYLKVDTESFRSFAAEFIVGRGQYERQIAAVSVLSGPLRYWSPYAWLPHAHAFRRLEDSIVSHYLLSTDFFVHDADETRLVNYLGLYNPFESVCRNPFGRPVETDL